jgi:hypothetical protein
MCEPDDGGNTALLLAAGGCCYPAVVQWLLEYEGVKINGTDNDGASVWYTNCVFGLPSLLRFAYIWGVMTANISPSMARMRHSHAHCDATRRAAAWWAFRVARGGFCTAAPADRARRRAAEGTAPRIPPAATCSRRRTLPSVASAPGLGAWLRGAHHHRTQGHGTRIPLRRAKRSRSERGQSLKRRSARLLQKRL